MANNFQDIANFVQKRTQKTYRGNEVEEQTYPFPLERLIQWLLSHDEGNTFVTVTVKRTMGDDEVVLSKGGAKRLRLDFGKNYIYSVYFSNKKLMDEGKLGKRINDVEIDLGYWIFPLSSLRTAFLLEKDKATIAKENYFNLILKRLEEFYPGMIAKGDDFIPKIESGRIEQFYVSVQGKGESYTNKEIGVIFSEVDDKALLLQEETPWTQDLVDFGVRLTAVTASVRVVSNNLTTIAFSFYFEIYTPDDYWRTIGYYLTLLDTSSRDNFHDEDLFELAQEWGVEANAKEEASRALLQVMKSFSWEDWRDSL